jgi:hypothetical protein
MNKYIGYIPRKCSYTRQLIIASDCASIQLSINNNKELEKSDGDKILLVICGNLRKQGKSDGIINELIEKADRV